MSKRSLAAVAAAVLVVAGCGADDESSAPAATTTSVAPADLSPCEVPGIPTAKCGSVTVPLDRAHPDAGTTTVGFTLVPRTDQAQPSLGTVVTNPGGPGTGAVDAVGHVYADGLKPILDRRDLLLIDPRGVGRSSPITCAALEGPEMIFASGDGQRAAIGECGKQLGDKARYYGTAAVADDFDDVRAALGLERLDLLGDSYGTYLMATYVARHPERVRSVVLSGAYPVHTDDNVAGGVAIAALRHATGLVCERTTSCSGDTVLNDLGALAARLRTAPVPMDLRYEEKTYPIVLDERMLAGTVGKAYAGSADVEKKLALAKALAAARTGDLAPVQDLVRAHLVELASIFALGPSVVSPALLWATTCHDYPQDFAYSDGAADRERDFDDSVRRQNAGDFAPFSPDAWLSRDFYDVGACLDWPNDPTAGAPFPKGTKLADVPALVLAGDLDANTSTTSGKQAAAQFPNARFVEVADAGHTPTSTPEGARLVMEFITADR